MEPTTIESNESAIRVGDSVQHVDTGEVGIVVCQWDFDGDVSDNYVVFFGDSFPLDMPVEKPYILRYYSTSLTKVDKHKLSEQVTALDGE